MFELLVYLSEWIDKTKAFGSVMKEHYAYEMLQIKLPPYLQVKGPARGQYMHTHHSPSSLLRATSAREVLTCVGTPSTSPIFSLPTDLHELRRQRLTETNPELLIAEASSQPT